MACRVSSQPTEVELQILRILWSDGPSIARRIQDSLHEFKKATAEELQAIRDLLDQMEDKS